MTLDELIETLTAIRTERGSGFIDVEVAGMVGVDDEREPPCGGEPYMGLVTSAEVDGRVLIWADRLDSYAD